MKKIIIAGCVVIFGLGFAYGPNLLENEKIEQEKKIAIELAVKSDELWVLNDNKSLSITTLNMSIERLVSLAKNNKEKMSDEEYMELLNTIQQLKAIKELREVMSNDLQ